MNVHKYDVAVIGGGPAGLAAAIAAAEQGASVVIVERDLMLGGILQQCIHLGFGLKYFGEELSGPEYAHRFMKKLETLNISILLHTMVLSIDETQLMLHVINSTDGNFDIEVGAIVLAMGCRERTRTALSIPGSRPAGVYTAGTAQRYLNMQNQKVGERIVVLGSGDIGMIMARRFSLEGAKVEGVVEIMPYLAGLTRNKVQCLDDFGIPLHLSHTIIDIRGRERLMSVVVAQVDENMQPKPETAWEIPCDTLLLSVGLIPENELSRKCGVALNPVTSGARVDQWMQTSRLGIFACGNVLHVNDLVDNVSVESAIAGTRAAEFAKNKLPACKEEVLAVEAGIGARYTVPSTIRFSNIAEDIRIYFRVMQPARTVTLLAKLDGETVARRKVPRVSPGEMESLLIPAAVLESGAGKRIVISVEGGDA